MHKRSLFLLLLASGLYGMQVTKKEHKILARNLGYIERYAGLQLGVHMQPIDRVLFALAQTKNRITQPTAQLILDKALQAGADIEARDEDGRTPLIKAAIYDSTSAILALCEAKASLNAQDRSGYTALHHAASRGYTLAILELITAGADVNSLDVHQTTPLMYAMLSYPYHRGAIVSLLKCGANPTIPDINGTTVLDYIKSVSTYFEEDNEINELLKNITSKI